MHNLVILPKKIMSMAVGRIVERWRLTLYLTILVLLTPSVLLAQKRVACIGDSVTEGLGLANPSAESYPAVLQQLLGDGFVVRNFGKSGATLLRKGHKPYCEQPEFEEALSFGADVAVVHLGLNDTDPRTFPHYRDEFVKDYVWLIDTLLSSNPQMQIYVCSMTPIFTAHSRFTSSTLEWHQALQAEIRKVIRARGTKFIDFFSAFEHHPNLIDDGPTLHPNKEGAALIARVVHGHLTGRYDFGVAQAWGSNMVLQKERLALLRGTANAGSKVTVRWRTKTYSTYAQEDGRWSLKLPTGGATKQGQTLTIKNQEKEIKFSNILVGQVWLAMGQSNMAWPLSNVEDGQRFGERALSNTQLRLLHLKPVAETDDVRWTPQQLQRANDLDFFEGAWSTNSENEARAFSALGYAFGAELQEAVSEPVGIIQLAVGGSPLISWVSRRTLWSDPRFHTAFNHWRGSDFIMRWCRERATTNCGPDASPFQRHPYEPSFNHEAGLRLLEGLPVAGVLWYQGESDAENSELHSELFPLFIEDLRHEFGDQLPIQVVQLSSLHRPSWPHFRAAQLELARSLCGVNLVVSHDLGTPDDVHPRRKLPLAHRMVQSALTSVYHRTELPGLAPLPLDLTMDSTGQYRLKVDTHGFGLETNDGAAVKGFALCTIEGEIVDIQVQIDGSDILFRIPDGLKATDLVFAWKPYSETNLIVRGGQPFPTCRIPLEQSLEH